MVPFDSLLSIVLIIHPLYFPESVETAYLLGTHHWEYEMLQEAGGEFTGVSVSVSLLFPPSLQPS